MAHKDENAVAMMTTMATEMRKKDERINNVVIAIPSATHIEPNCEADFVKNLASNIGIAGTRIKTARRIKSRSNGINAVSSVVKNDQVLLVVEMESTEAKIDMLRKSKILREKPEYNNVYVNEDLTPSERVANRKLRQERDRKNNELTGSDVINGRTLKFKICNDGKKRFWGIRNGELKLVLSMVHRQ